MSKKSITNTNISTAIFLNYYYHDSSINIMSLLFELPRNATLQAMGLVIRSSVHSARERMTSPRAYNLAYEIIHLINSLSLCLRTGHAQLSD